LSFLTQVKKLTFDAGAGDKRGGVGHVRNSSKFYREDFQTFPSEEREVIWKKALQETSVNLGIDELVKDWALRVHHTTMYEFEAEARFNVILEHISLSEAKRAALGKMVEEMPDGVVKAFCTRGLQQHQGAEALAGAPAAGN
jgi:hypothetical protein